MPRGAKCIRPAIWTKIIPVAKWLTVECKRKATLSIADHHSGATPIYMRQIIGSVVTLFTVAALAGCASSSPARSSGDVVSAMNNELAHTVDQGPEAPVGTTTLTSATIEPEPTALPEDRMSVKEANKKLQVEPLPEPASAPIPGSGH